MPCSVLILTASTGGGHDSVAIALAQALRYRAGKHVRVHIAAPLGPAIDAAYGWALNHAPHLWGACYHLSNNTQATAIGERLLAIRAGRLAQLIERERPDLVLSVHALCAQLAAQTLCTLDSPVPHHCVVTDLVNLHRTWIAPGVATYYAATLQARLALLRGGVAPEHIVLSGLPVRRPFWSGAGESDQGMPCSKAGSAPFRLLVMDGGQPGPALLRATRILLETGLALEITMAWGRTAPSVHLGFPTPPCCVVRHLPLGAAIAPHMRAADLIVTKAGSVTIAEAMALGRPIVLHRAAPGQEEDNPALVVSATAGLAALSPETLTAAVRRLHANPHERLTMARCAAAAGRPAAAEQVATAILASLGEATPASLRRAIG